jgi:hypothetical protein
VRRNRVSVVLVWLLALASVNGGCGGCNSLSDRSVPPWPEETEVERITARVSGSITGDPDLADFEIPAEYVPAVLRPLGPPQYHKHPPNVQEVAWLRVHCKDGRELELRLFFYGKEPVLFTLQGVPCIRGGRYVNLGNEQSPKYLPEVLTLEGLLRAVHGHDRAKAQEYLDLLDQSAGRIAPPKR